jgi:hypothetical protein
MLPMAPNISAEKDKSRAAHCCAALQSSSVSVLGQAERLQRWPIVSPMVNDAHVSVAIQGHIAREGQISPRMCAVAIFLIRPAVDARPQTRRLLLL